MNLPGVIIRKLYKDNVRLLWQMSTNQLVMIWNSNCGLQASQEPEGHGKEDSCNSFVDATCAYFTCIICRRLFWFVSVYNQLGGSNRLLYVSPLLRLVVVNHSMPLFPRVWALGQNIFVLLISGVNIYLYTTNSKAC